MNTIANQPDPKMAKPATSAAWSDAQLQNPHEVADKRQRVQKMFAAIAPSYDLNNRLHSLWQDQRWRRKAVELSQLNATDVIVDVACGTAELTLAMYKGLVHANDRVYRNPQPAQMLGIDFTFEMLPFGARKWWEEVTRPVAADEEHPDTANVCFVNGDAQSLPLPDQSADVVSIAFGIRNVQDPFAAMREFHRILRPGGRVIILEFSLPINPILRRLYNFYFHHILPRTATWISRNKTGAYRYLPHSVTTFIGRAQMMSMMRDAGFARVEQFPMTFGVCVCYRGCKT